MRLIGEEYKPIPEDEYVVNHHFWVFDVSERDFFLKYKPHWQSIRTVGFELEVEGGTTVIPANFYILIGDVEGRLDWLKVDEAISREFEAFVITPDFQKDTWQILPLKIINAEKREFRFPYIKNPVPVYIENNKSIMVSQVDLYNKMSSFNFVDIV